MLLNAVESRTLSDRVERKVLFDQLLVNLVLGLQENRVVVLEVAGISIRENACHHQLQCTYLEVPRVDHILALFVTARLFLLLEILEDLDLLVRKRLETSIQVAEELETNVSELRQVEWMT